jgi:signal transduction histidine kinase/ActR/RegA family two-component response regulator
VFNLALLTALIASWVTTPLKRVSDALDRSELAPVAPYLEAKHEFGTLARLIRNFFEQRQALMGEIEMRKQYESHLREARDQAHQSAKSKADFLSVISHELRTPLNAVIGLAALLLEQQPRSDQREHLETLKFSAENLLGLINDVLDFNKLDAGGLTLERRPIDLRALTAGVVRSFAPQVRAKGLSLTANIADELPPRVMADPLRLAQVLGNLLSNAIKFTESGGVTLAVTVSAETAERVRVAFRVSDTGIGIPPDQQGHIFELFTQAESDPTRRFGGTGLGLTIVKRLVELMGGGIVVESSPGRGATFRFILELERAPATANAAGAGEPPPADLRGQHILVVEDNPVNRQLAVTFLRRWGAEVDTAEQGDTAVEMAAKRPYDLILMDLQMPSMSGVEAAERIRQQSGSPNLRTPIIAFTATAPTGEPAELEPFGFDGYITKPIDPAHLREAIARHLDVAPQRRARG